MNIIDVVSKLTAPLRSKVASMIGRAVVTVIDDSTKIQSLQVTAGALDETRSDVERFQNYGMSSNPPEDAEAVVVFPGGRRDHPIAIAVDDRRYRIKNLESGEVVIYDKTGTTILLKSNGDIEITPSSGKATMTADLKIVGKLEVTGDAKLDAKLDVTGKGTFSDAVDVGTTLTASTDVVGGGKHLKTHTHPVPASGLTAPSSGGPVTGSATSSAPT